MSRGVRLKRAVVWPTSTVLHTGTVTEVRNGERLLAAVDIARAALLDDGQQPGAHRRSVAEGDWAAAHYFDAELAGYRGWQWCVVLAGAPGSDEITLSEVVLLPGEGALLAPAWVPWSERITSDDLGPGDLLAAEPDDARLVPNQYDTGDEFRFDSESTEPDDIGQVAGELGLGRRRLLSAEGRADAAQRWYDGDFGPTSEMAQSAPFPCCTCGFYVPLSGALRAGFGACANEYAADGRVVSAEYGCGAHSDVKAPSGGGSPAYDAYDDGAIEIISGPARDAEPARS